MKANEPDAWSRFVRLYGPLVYQWCRRAGLQDADAVDVGQDVFAAVATAIGTFRRDREGDTLRGWLRVVTRNKIRDLIRRQAANAPGAGGSDAQAKLLAIPDRSAEPDDTPDPDEEDVLLRRGLEMVLTDFKEQTRRAFLGVVVERRDAAEVARELGITVNAVYLAKARVMRRVREEFAGLIDL